MIEQQLRREGWLPRDEALEAWYPEEQCHVIDPDFGRVTRDPFSLHIIRLCIDDNPRHYAGHWFRRIDPFGLPSDPPRKPICKLITPR